MAVCARGRGDILLDGSLCWVLSVREYLRGVRPLPVTSLRVCVSAQGGRKVQKEKREKARGLISRSIDVASIQLPVQLSVEKTNKSLLFLNVLFCIYSVFLTETFFSFTCLPSASMSSCKPGEKKMICVTIISHHALLFLPHSFCLIHHWAPQRK